MTLVLKARKASSGVATHHGPEIPAGARALHGSEELFFRLDDICPMNLAVHARIAGELRERDLQRGIRDAEARHAALRMRIEKRGLTACFEPSCARTQLRVERASLAELPRIYADEGQTPFITSHGPLARVVLVRHADDDSTLILTCHHAIADAKSALIVLGDTLRGAASSAGVDPRRLREPLFESQWSRFPPCARGIRGWLRHARPLARFTAAAIRHPPADLGTRNGGGPRRLHVVPLELDEATTLQIVRRAHDEETTVHAALQASMALALAEETACRLPATALFGTAVCLRSRLQPPVEDACGYFVSGLAWLDEIASGSGSFWPFARQLKSSIEAAMLRDEHWLALPYVHRMHAWVGRWLGSARTAPYYARYLEKTSPPGVMVSNVGRWDFASEFGMFRVESAGFFANQSVLGNVALLSLTVNDRLALDFVGSSPAVSRDGVARIANHCVKRLVAEAALEGTAVCGAAHDQSFAAAGAAR